jgi:CRP-like cAMP-binding protein
MAIESFEGILSAHPFFAGLPPAHLGTLAGCAANVKIPVGAYLFREGQTAERFFVIRFGRVAVETFAPSRGPVTIETVDADDVLGWSWFFPPYRWHFDARAVTLVRALALDGVCLRRKCEEDPALGYELLKRFAKVVVSRLEATQLQLLDLYVERP